MWLDRCWQRVGGLVVSGTLDPIDGTKGFLRNDQYAIALALIEDGEVKVAALACPALPISLDVPDSPTGSRFVAVRGEGAQMASLSSGAFEPIRVSQGAGADGSRFVESVEAGHGNQALQATIARAAGITRSALRSRPISCARYCRAGWVVLV